MTNPSLSPGLSDFVLINERKIINFLFIVGPTYSPYHFEWPSPKEIDCRLWTMSVRIRGLTTII